MADNQLKLSNHNQQISTKFQPNGSNVSKSMDFMMCHQMGFECMNKNRFRKDDT